jgi:transcriptional antiterminator RfaH
MLAWHVIYTKPSQETRACIEITRSGFESFIPIEHYSRIHNHRKEACTRALFPRYVFARFDPNSQPWGFLMNVRGVSDVLRSPSGKPLSLTDRAMEAIRNRPDPDIVSRETYRIGQRIRINEGILAGYEGLYQGSPKERVMALLDILGRRVEIPLAVVSAA